MFWDSSAVVLLLVEERGSKVVRRLPAEPRALWWGTRVECVSGVWRLWRAGIYDAAMAEVVIEGLVRLVAQSVEIQPTDAVRERAERLLRVHPLRAANALQLSAALAYCEEQPRGVGFVCLDDRLRDAARAEGFTLQPPRP